MAAPVSEYELASRLSYFLWSSTPDAELLRLAGNKKLSKPAVLEAQVRRMLKDPKSQALVENFAGQWLQFKNIDVLRPDGEKFPEFDEALRHSMRRETELFIDNIFRNNGSILEFLDADYSFLNERLARFYGVKGRNWTRVSTRGHERNAARRRHSRPRQRADDFVLFDADIAGPPRQVDSRESAQCASSSAAALGTCAR